MTAAILVTKSFAPCEDASSEKSPMVAEPESERVNIIGNKSGEIQQEKQPQTTFVNKLQTKKVDKSQNISSTNLLAKYIS